MGYKHYQTAEPPPTNLGLSLGLFGVHLLIIHFKFQFSKSIKSSTLLFSST